MVSYGPISPSLCLYPSRSQAGDVKDQDHRKPGLLLDLRVD
jgi:hypothetical protein